MKNSNKVFKSVSELVKEFGAKVTRHPKYISSYIYNGKNFTATISKESCETTWWEVETSGNNINPIIIENFGGVYSDNKFDTKTEVIGFLFQLDKSL